MENIVIILVLIIITVCAGLYIYRAKSKGNRCVGCPDCNNCKKGSLESCCVKKEKTVENRKQ